MVLNFIQCVKKYKLQLVYRLKKIRNKDKIAVRYIVKGGNENDMSKMWRK